MGPVGATLGVIGGVAKDVAGPVLTAVPTKAEREEKRRVKADEARLAGGAGGLSPGERQQMLAEAYGQQGAAQRAAEAQLSRSAGQGFGSGMQQEAQQNILRGAQDARLQAASGVRAADLASGAQQRAELDARRQAIIDRAYNRRMATAAAVQGATGATTNAALQGAKNRGSEDAMDMALRLTGGV